MRMNRFLFAAGVSLAMALTFSCSEVDDILGDDSSSSGVVVGGNSSSSDDTGSNVTPEMEAATSLTSGQWKSGSLDMDESVWYKFSSNPGFIWWNDRYSGDGTEDMADIRVEAFDRNGNLIYLNNNESADDMDYSPFMFEFGGTVYLKVTRFGGEGSTFGIKFATSNPYPSGANKTDAIPFYNGPFETVVGSLYTEGDVVWYKFRARSTASIYYIGWQDLITEEDADMTDIVLEVYDGNGELLAEGDDEGYIGFYPESIGPIYIKVIRISDEDDEGTSFRLWYEYEDECDEYSGYGC
jgi:hypothetical protein